MSATLPILHSLKDHLGTHLPDWSVELMPDDPSEYHLAHPVGAVLISYAGSKFDKVRPSARVTQTRTLHIVITVMSRNLHDDVGAIAVLDELRLLTVGYRPPDCGEMWLIEEQFDGVATGIWQYQLVLCADTVQVQRLHNQQKPVLTEVIARQKGQALDERLIHNQSQGDNP